MTKEPLAEAPEKFFFNQHIFDEDHIVEDDVEEEEPPAPVFSEAELKAAKKEAFGQGRAQALQDAKNSREQHLANLMTTLAQDMSKLFAQEEQRERLYEKEVVMLSLKALDRILPHYTAQHGFAELESTLKRVIQSHNKKQKILIRVHSGFVEAVKTLMEGLKQQNPELRFDVQGEDSMQGAECHLLWDNGGTVHNTDAISEEILQILKDGLAANAATGHDNSDIQKQVAQSPVTDSSEPEASSAGLMNPGLKETPDE